MSASTHRNPDTALTDTALTDTAKPDWASLDSRYERLIDPSDPLFADRPRRSPDHGRARVIRWHPDLARA